MSGVRPTMRFGILGPLEAWRDGKPVELGGPRLRLLLALLLVNAGQVVPSARLIDGLWGESAPAGAPNALRALVSRVRAALGAELVESRAGGYRLVAAPDAVDGERFERLLAEGRAALAAGDPARAAELLRAGLALWRGEPLADLGQPDALRAEIARLGTLRLDATGDRIEAELARGPHAGLVAELEALVAAHPLNERLHGLLMRALYVSGYSFSAARWLAAWPTAPGTRRGSRPWPPAALGRGGGTAGCAVAASAPGRASISTWVTAARGLGVAMAFIRRSAPRCRRARSAADCP